MILPERKNPSTKELIIDIISTNLDANAKIVYNKIRHSKKVTYHAVFKLLNQMVDENILLKNKRIYSLNPLWIKNTKEYFQKLELSYLNKQEALLINKDSKKFILPSLHEGFIMLMRAMERGVFGDNKVVVGHFSHLLLILLSEEETDLLRRLGQQRKFYYLVKNNSNVDKMIAHYNKHTFNYKTKLGVPCAEPFYLYVLGDTIIQINLPIKMRDAMDRVYNEPTSTSLFPKPKNKQITTFLNEVARKKMKIHVHVIKNKEAAQDIIKKTLRHF